MHGAHKLCVNAAVPQSLASLPTIGLVSKSARQDARSFFYASTDLRLFGDGIAGLGFFGLLQKLLQKLGLGGTANLYSLWSKSRLRPMDYTRPGRLAFRSFLCSVAFCSNLRRFNMDLSVHHVFGSDQDELKALFPFDRELPVPGLEIIATVLASLPKLTEVQIAMRPHIQVDGWTPGHEGLLREYAISGVRQVALWVVIEERLQANNLQEVRNGADKRKFGHVSVDIEYTSLPRFSEGDKTTVSALGLFGTRGRSTSRS